MPLSDPMYPSLRISYGRSWPGPGFSASTHRPPLQRHIAPVSFSLAQILINPSQWLLFAKQQPGRHPLNSDLEKDFRNHQQMLLRLFNERKVLLDGSLKALELDKQICKVENVVRSYQTVKWYEQELQQKKLLAHQELLFKHRARICPTSDR